MAQPIPARHWLLVVVPVVTLGVAAAVALYSVQRMAAEVNVIEAQLNERSVGAAIQSVLRRIGQSHSEYAVWNDAVRSLYGEPDPGFVDENYAASTETGTLFETVYLLDEGGNPVFGFHRGEPVSVPPAEAYGAAFAGLYERAVEAAPAAPATDLLPGAWGLEAVAIGAVVPNTDEVSFPDRLRYLVIGRVIDDALVARLADDYVIDDLRLADGPSATGMPLRDSAGAALGWLAWNPSAAGTVAMDQIYTGIVVAFGLVGLGAVGFSLLAAVSIRRGDVLAGDLALKHARLVGAFASVPNGVAMFDADRRLIMCNARYAEMYMLPPRLVEPGTTLREIFEYRHSIGNAPVDAPNYVSHAGIDWVVGGTKVFQFDLEDGRTVRINHLNMEGGSYIATHEDITETLATEKRIAEYGRRDSLTDLPNQAAFRDLVDSLVADPTHPPLAVLSIDLDRFRDVNDALGHAEGDRILAMAADRLRTLAGSGGTVARLGADAFAIVQTGMSQPEGARNLARAVCATLGEPFLLDGTEITVGASIGIALSPGQGNTASDLIHNAEAALYWTKGHGRNGFQFFDPAMGSQTRAYQRIVAGLRSALDRGEFSIHYQPVIDLRSGTTIGFEALLRWRSAELGDVSPMDFIPVAEESGLIVPIGEWVLRNACLEASKWPYRYYVAVNLSSVQFRDEQLAMTVFSALANAGLAATRLELEVTETVLLADEKRVRATLHRLRASGVRILMDDFGTGYSSLNYLRSFPFDKLKIDQSFIRDLPESQEAKAIVRAVVGLGAEFGLTIIAEGVETADQSRFLLEAGCAEAQGFYFGAPTAMPLRGQTAAA